MTGINVKPLVIKPTRPMTTTLGTFLLGAVALLIAAQIIVNSVVSALQHPNIPPVVAGVGGVLLIVIFTGPIFAIAIAAWRGRRWARVGGAVLGVGALWMALGLVISVVISSAAVIVGAALLWMPDARAYAAAIWEARHS
jgi:hypothetical protein